ncbi:MAG: DUF5615 family PIN-like protein [Truepera sp.]|nr:DUF5615 family PIN-like protein [Truepera sp.]
MGFLIDAQLPPALARWLMEQGCQAEHVLDLGFAGADDRMIWDYAVLHGLVIVTKDEDFALRRALAATGPAIVWIRVGNTRKDALLRWFAPLLVDILAALKRGEPLLEIG